MQKPQGSEVMQLQITKCMKVTGQQTSDAP